LGQVESWFFLTVWMAVLIGLPVALVVLGLRLLAQPRPVRLRWKVLVILASIIGICSAYLLSAVMALHYVDSGAHLRIEIGEYLALLASLAVLAAGSVLPSVRPMMVG
jgi:NhaP-type Na+/H+ or K+/H+ antiporter